VAENGVRPRLILAICCLSIFIVSLDNTIVQVALPSVRHELHASLSQLQWTIDAYTLVLASLLMVSGSMADRFGRTRVFRLGLGIFTLGSLLCSLAWSPGALIGFRVLQAVGGSMLNPVAMSIIRNTFTDPRERAQAIGIWGAVVGLSMAFGPLVGGSLIGAGSWRSIFWINIPVGLVAIALTWRFIPESRAPRPWRVDPIGQGLVALGLATTVYAIIESAPLFGVVAFAAFAALVVHERRHEEPLIDPRFFRSAPFSGASLIAILSFTALGGFLFLTNLFLQEQRGLSAFQTGLYTLPMAVTAFFAAPLSGRLVGSRGARFSLVAGAAALTVACTMLTSVTVSTTTLWLLAGYLVFGLGFGLINPPITNTAVSGMPEEQAGVAAAVASTSRLVGISLGVAIVGAISTATGWWVLAGCAAAAVVLGVLSTTPWALRTAEAI
jgi:EmrB/QacA subfamily drug resistance transporter